MARARRQAANDGGFSLMEAMVVLIIGGMALMLVFAIGGRAAGIGFGLGRRALAVTDGELAEDNLRELMHGVSIPPAEAGSGNPGIAVFNGGPQGFEGDAILGRSTLCASAGPVQRLRVRIEPLPDGDRVTCAAGAGAPRVAADLRPRRASFAYSTDGVRWGAHWTSTPDIGPATTGPRARSVYIRLASADGAVEILEAAASGRPALYPARAVVPAHGGAPQ